LKTTDRWVPPISEEEEKEWVTVWEWLVGPWAASGVGLLRLPGALFYFYFVFFFSISVFLFQIISKLYFLFRNDSKLLRII
jgi:hypothetical protein